MSSFNVPQYFQLLRQQVMSPAAMESQYSIKLNGENFDKWYRRLSKIIAALRIEFFEYFNNDGMVTSIPPEIQANETFRISVLNILDTAMETAILTSSMPVIQDVIRDFISENDESSALELMRFLKKTYGTQKVNTTSKLFNQVKDIFNKPLDDKKKWVTKIISLIISQTIATNSAQYGSEIEKKNAIRMMQDNFEALALIGVCPEYQTLCLTHFGRAEMMNVADVVSLISTNSKQTETTMIASSGSNKNGKRTSKPRCFACNQRHFINECPEFKKHFPNSSIIKKYTNKTAQKGVDSSQLKTNQHRNEDAWISSTGTNVKHDNWIFDTGSTIHICNDRSKFVTFTANEGSQIAGVAGNVSIEGYGKVVTNTHTFHNVAYVPSLPFNLLSVAAAETRANIGFSFIAGEVFLLANGKCKKVGYRVGNLYVLGTPAKSEVNVEEYTFLSNAHLQPLLNVGHEDHTLSDANLMHARLGHPSIGLYNRLAPIIEAPRLQTAEFSLCPSCCI